MKEVFDMVINSDINNSKIAIIVSVVILVIALNCIEALYLSKVELLLMRGNHSMKRTSFLFIIMFGVFIFMNFIFLLDESCSILCILYFLGALLFYGIMKLLYKFGKCMNWFDKHKEGIQLFIAITFSVSFLFLVYLVSGNKMYCIIFGALIETILIAMFPFEAAKMISKYYVEIEEEKWYLLRRMNNNLMLLGDSDSPDASTKVRMIQFDELLNKNILKIDEKSGDDKGKTT